MRALRSDRKGIVILRWIGRIALGLLAFVVLAVIGVVMFMHTGFGQEFVRKQVESKLASTFVGGATVGHVGGTPFTDIVVSDLVINGPDRKPAIRVGELHLHAGILPLISHQLVLTKLVADDVDVLVKRDANGELQLEHLTRPGPPSTWNVHLPSVEVHRAHVMIDTGKDVVDLDGIEIGARADLPHGGPVDFGAAVSALWRQKRARIGLAANVHADAEHVTVPLLVAAIADASIAGSGLDIPKGGRGPISGTLAVRAPATTIAALAPSVQLPDDVALEIEATPDGEQTLVALAGTIGRSPLHGLVHADLGAKTAAGFLGGARLDVGTLSRGKLAGRGNVFAVFDAAPPAHDGELPRAHAIVQTWGDVGDMPATAALVALDTAGDRVRATVGAANTEGLRAAVAAQVRRDGKATTLERAELVATTPDPARATGGKAPLHGVIDARLVASGPLSPEADLAIAGHVDAMRLRMKDLTARALHLRIDAAHAPAHPIGTARVEVTDVSRGNLQLRELTLAAGNRPDGKIQVTLRTEPKPAPWLLDLDALVTPGKTVAIDLQRHFVRAAGGSTWHGNTGHVEIGPERIAVRDLESSSADGKLAVDATYMRAGRAQGDLWAKLAGKLDLANLGTDYHGSIDANVDVARRGGRWQGTVNAKATGINPDPRSAITLDGNAKVELRPGHVTANIDASSLRVGSAKVAADIATPANIANARAWRAMPRSAIRNVDINLQGIDLQALAKMAGLQGQVIASGRLDGDLRVEAGKAGGIVQVRGVAGKSLRDLGQLSADVRVDQTGKDEITTVAFGRIPTIGGVELQARVATPDRLFDPDAWKKLGLGALRGASARAERITFDPGTLERLGVVSQLRGNVGFTAELDDGLRGANITADVRDLHGGVIAMPVDVHVAVTSDEHLTRVAMFASSAQRKLLEVSAHLPVTLPELRANPKAVRTAPLAGKITVPHVEVRPLLAMLGNTQATGGTIDGTIDVGGTVAKPTANAHLIARDVSVPPGGGGTPVQVVQRLEIQGKWDGAAGQVAITGEESGGGRLRLTAGGRADAPKEIGGTLEATKLDIAPLVAFLPGPAGGLAGRIDAKLDVRGIDPKTSQIGGQLKVSEARLPIAPQIGTLFHGAVDVRIQNHLVNVQASGKLGNGEVKLVGAAPLDGAAPTGGQVHLTVRKVQLIGTTEPIIDATVLAKLGRQQDQWQAQIDISKAFVRVPEEKGEKLKPAGAPPDLVYAGPEHHHTPPSQVQAGPEPHRRPPEHPAMVADIVLHDAKIESKEFRGNATGKLRVTMGGKEVGVVGNVNVTRGDLDLFDRRYNVDRAALHFDGSTDPELDVRITHDFPDVTTITEVRGRASKPELHMSSQPGTYSQAELLGFLLGGEPGGDPNQAPSATAKVEGAGASFVANKIGGYVKQALPVDIDVLRYESASATSSAAVTVGTWITHDLFLAYRRHLEARPDENAGEGEIEYWLQRRLSLTGTIGDRGYDGVDLLWRRRW